MHLLSICSTRFSLLQILHVRFFVLTSLQIFSPIYIRNLEVLNSDTFAISPVPLFAVLLVFSKCKCVFASLFVIIWRMRGTLTAFKHLRSSTYFSHSTHQYLFWSRISSGFKSADILGKSFVLPTYSVFCYGLFLFPPFWQLSNNFQITPRIPVHFLASLLLLQQQYMYSQLNDIHFPQPAAQFFVGG